MVAKFEGQRHFAFLVMHLGQGCAALVATLAHLRTPTEDRDDAMAVKPNGLTVPAASQLLQTTG